MQTHNTFCVWLLSLSKRLPRVSREEACIRTPFLVAADDYSTAGWATLASSTRPSDAGHSGRRSLSGYRDYCCHEYSGTGMCLTPVFHPMGHTPLEGNCPYHFALILLCGSLQLSRTDGGKRDSHRGPRRQRTYRREPGKPGASALPPANGGRLELRTASAKMKNALSACGKANYPPTQALLKCIRQPETLDRLCFALAPLSHLPSLAPSSEVTAAHVSTQIHQRHLSLTMVVGDLLKCNTEIGYRSMHMTPHKSMRLSQRTHIQTQSCPPGPPVPAPQDTAGTFWRHRQLSYLEKGVQRQRVERDQGGHATSSTSQDSLPTRKTDSPKNGSNATRLRNFTRTGF